jgi:hypothetical protein
MNYIYDIKAPCGLFLGGDYRATDIANGKARLLQHTNSQLETF